ncbi:3-oxoacyl-ACP reductase FabG [Flammeovirga aprica]|uniref:3-oxoacyl-ACP reductase FabG n=1 Tax=Flammeovirga aprica JL-4 TaxID=694437 RepID=A0A7X9P0R0_9BACT|nr:3-oxoacyl-ACP reductase FabG [Flammeovirga aprica]NME66524.1 3-oxoacyl-ACP reductase FabG [Flammeovirga aprica JL-4]
MKYALVTGASRGIGRAVAVKLAQDGYNILINFQSNVEAANETLELVRQEGQDGELLKFDVSSKEEVNEVLGTWVEEHTEDVIEVLVNNAGFRKDAVFLFMEDEEWDSVLDVNLKGFNYVTRSVLKGMLTQKFGRVINIVSLSGIKGMPGQTNYSAAKAGVIGATKALAQEVGRRKVTVNAVAPGFIKTEMTEDLDEKQLKSLIPAKRFGEASEVAAAVGFLASKDASYITGEVLSINGGLYT